jgi:hypothetical protein
MINFNINWYVEKYLPGFIRKTNNVRAIKALVKPLLSLLTDFYNFRIEMIYRTNLTSQRLSLESHLNKIFDPIQKRILIAHYSDSGLFFPLSDEGYEGTIVSLESENDGLFIALDGEVREEIGVSFLIYAPTGLNNEMIKGEIEQYKLAGKTYEIINF